MSTDAFYIDHVITNITSLFMKSWIVVTGTSDHQKLIMSIYRTTFAKDKVKKYFIAVIRILVENVFTRLY